MPENEFEKQVQQIFGDMRLKPSDAVWSKVRERVSHEKKRRRMLVWLPAALLLLGGGMYWALDTNNSLQKNKHEAEAVANAGNSSEAVGSNNAHPQAADAPENNSGNTPSQTAPGAALPNESSKSKPGDIREAELPPAATTTQQQVNKSISSGAASNGRSLPVNEAAGKKLIHLQNKPAQKNTVADDVNTSVINVGGQETATSNNTDQSLLPVLGTYQYVDGYEGLKDIAGEKELKHFDAKNNKPVIKLAKRKSWEWGVTAQAGVSMVGKGLSNIFKNGLFEKAESLDYMQYATPATPNGNFLGSQGQGNLVAAAPAPASAVKAGMAWNAGIFGKWHVRQKLALTFGAEYNLYTTNREVGNIVDPQYFNTNNSNVSADANARFAAYYTGSDGINYTNRYHFVQVPVGIQWQLNKGIKVPPVQLDAGLVFGYLVSTNAVHYKGGVYYEDKSLFNKFQTGLYAGFSVKLFQHAQRPLYIGPTVQYNLSGVAKPSSGIKQNFVYGGLKAQWVLFKN
ncbi:MAG: hypothetical protein ACTHLE_15155 [Agriterribacter sp.]